MNSCKQIVVAHGVAHARHARRDKLGQTTRRFVLRPAGVERGVLKLEALALHHVKQHPEMEHVLAISHPRSRHMHLQRHLIDAREQPRFFFGNGLGNLVLAPLAVHLQHREGRPRASRVSNKNTEKRRQRRKHPVGPPRGQIAIFTFQPQLVKEHAVLDARRVRHRRIKQVSSAPRAARSQLRVERIVAGNTKGQPRLARWRVVQGFVCMCMADTFPHEIAQHVFPVSAPHLDHRARWPDDASCSVPEFAQCIGACGAAAFG